jgi:Protein of unknown function (DUF3108)
LWPSKSKRHRFDLLIPILRNFLFMQSGLRRKRLLIPVCAMLPLFAPAFQTHEEAKTTGPSHENLEYEVEWRLISAGRAKLSLANFSPESTVEREMKLHLESTGLVSRLFHVNDDYTADATGNYCAESTFMTAHEGSRDRETKVEYDASAHKAVFHEHDFAKNTTISHEVGIPNCSHDIVSGLYQLRTMALEPGKSVFLPISDGKKSVSMKIECQRREEIRTPLGPRKTLLYEIFAFNDVLYQRPGHVHVWLTDDARRVPVQIEIRLQFTIGTITLRLAKDEKTS